MMSLLERNLLANSFSVVGSRCRNLWKEQGTVKRCEVILPERLSYLMVTCKGILSREDGKALLQR